MFSTNERRLFVKNTHDEELLRVCSLAQSTDGSITFSWSDFSNTEWHLLDTHGRYQREGNVGQGKFTIHGSGIAAFRKHDEKQGHKGRIKGNLLCKMETSIVGMRHLITLFPSKLNFVEPKARKKDVIFQSTVDIKPMVMVFFALPALNQQYQAHFNLEFHAQDCTDPPDVSLGAFKLRQHHIGWICYRTKNLDHWPANVHALHHDGFLVPILIGREEGEMKVEYRNPEISFANGKLLISLPLLKS